MQIRSIAQAKDNLQKNFLRKGVHFVHLYFFMNLDTSNTGSKSSPHIVSKFAVACLPDVVGTSA